MGQLVAREEPAPLRKVLNLYICCHVFLAGLDMAHRNGFIDPWVLITAPGQGVPDVTPWCTRQGLVVAGTLE